MKLRIKDQSVRFRLTQNEVRQLLTTSKISASTYLGSKTLSYEIEGVTGSSCNCLFKDEKICIHIPINSLNAWCSSDQISLQYELRDSERFPSLQILIEKDFKCLIERTGEDESDLYPNPQALQ
ncbi:MAG: hypothetical protein HKN87_23890 [Saprospiraceae bacterium]|nr:hypothetical protein [Saprospiraceae bacterium]